MGRRGRSNLTEERFYFVTTTVVKFTPIFTNNHFCDILISNIKHYREKYKYIVLGYVIMPSHFHWILIVTTKYGTISDIMRDIKKFTAWQIFDTLNESSELLKIFHESAEGLKDQTKKLWMPRFDDEVIRSQQMFWAKLNYIHNNPVKAGLVSRAEDYKYSSARNYVNGDHTVLEVDVEYAGIRML
ncbi:MAG: transposase [bacterium]|nr:transposase [bacterium]